MLSGEGGFAGEFPRTRGVVVAGVCARHVAAIPNLRSRPLGLCNHFLVSSTDPTRKTTFNDCDHRLPEGARPSLPT